MNDESLIWEAYTNPNRMKPISLGIDDLFLIKRKAGDGYNYGIFDYSQKPRKMIGHISGFEKDYGIYDVSDYLTKLFEMGWFRITYYSDTLYMHNTKVIPNRKQLNVMKDVAIENDMQNIKLDNEDIDRILWTNQDY